MKSLQEIVRANRRGAGVGLYSICSANRHVLEAGLVQALTDDAVVCIESTSNQVNQFGGYMGCTPAEFARYVKGICAEAEFSAERIVLGGDHLGPHVWQDETAESAMLKARQLVRDCVLAGYTKIHIDTGMRCFDDPGRKGDLLGQELVAARTSDLCAVAEAAWKELPAGSPAPLYVIGAEVPSPGGAQAEDPNDLVVTPVADVERSLTLMRESFRASGLDEAWERVIAIVVQPGVEFGDAWVHEYDREKSRSLTAFIKHGPALVFEAHSTDYQPPRALKRMVEDHFAILKVGPWLTYAFREAVFALAAMEEELLSGKRGAACSRLREVLEGAMLSNPSHWIKHYQGDEAGLRFSRKYSYSDRSRYYWARPEVLEALRVLVQNLSDHQPPLTLLSQHMPAQYWRVRGHEVRNAPADLIHDKILEVLRIYSAACGLKSTAN